jgi:very-short-patch-repair endonuclease
LNPSYPTEEDPSRTTNWIKAQFGNRATVKSDCYAGLFSSQHMVLQERLNEPLLRQALAKNPVVQAKIGGNKVAPVGLREITDDGLEDLGLVLPCDDHQLRIIQLSNEGSSLQVEGPPGTGKSQTIANIISNALYKGRRALLVCDKKAAIVQVEERLTNCGLKPALLNLHDEDLDKREFLKQATEAFSSSTYPFHTTKVPVYPFDRLRETRQTLNERVRFGRKIAHPSLQVSNREALNGLIQLRKELANVPNISIENWQSLSKERLDKLLKSIMEWPEFAEIVTDSKNIWNQVRFETFDSNFDASKELTHAVHDTLEKIARIDEYREMMSAIGIELPFESDDDVNAVYNLVMAIVERPECQLKIIGNPNLTIRELEILKSEWDKRRTLVAANYPVFLDQTCSPDVEKSAKVLLDDEKVNTWQQLSEREEYHLKCRTKIENAQAQYHRLCNQIGLVYSTLLKVRRAQYLAVLNLGKYGGLIPCAWWNASVKPVLLVSGWQGKLQACIEHQKTAPLPLHFTALETIAETRWKSIDSLAEHGFSWITGLHRLVDTQRCKVALKQAYPSIPLHGFKQWHEVSIHAEAARDKVKALRAEAEGHAFLKQITENYLSIAHIAGDQPERLASHEEIGRLNKAAVLVEQWRERNDLFEVSSAHWQTFWEVSNANLMAQVETALSDLDNIVLPNQQSDNFEEALRLIDCSLDRIRCFLETYEKAGGDRSQSVLTSFKAQKEYSNCTNKLDALAKYLEIQPDRNDIPDWNYLQKVLIWRDLFQKLCGKQKLDVDSASVVNLRIRLEDHRKSLEQAHKEMDAFFEDWPVTTDYKSFKTTLQQVLEEMPRHQLWLYKKRWQKKLGAFPELKSLWDKMVENKVQPDCAERLFCFNLLRLCNPITEPQGPELKQTLNAFRDQDAKLADWVLDHLKSRLKDGLTSAASNYASSSSELRRLAGLMRIKGTIREIIKAHFDYLIAAKPCWMMSPTSLANLIETDIFSHKIPFDMVIFDEASQIRVLDGLLSMAFGKQVIIVGDKHQLPPTDFFLSFADTEQEAETEDFGIAESLLEEFAGVFEEDKTHAMLMSHYRSETPDLIRFSNDWFYSREPGKPGSGQLEMYPPAHISGIGRRLHYVPNANYSEVAGQRNNPAEAREVVKLIELHVRDNPDKTLGVVTMNIPQMDLIEDGIQATPQQVRTFCSDPAKFFVRNLEQVQGDEMDRIILSLTYGKNPSGQFNASVLGPLIKSGGERRLNVAITRSRSGMTVVSSLKLADLATSGAQSNGFRCLKALLMDLENSEQTRNYGISSRRFEKSNNGVNNQVHCESPFEEQVVEFLENEGYDLECQYGDGRYRLDIVVKQRGRYLLAIECDGARYHSSLVARTRDRARQNILKSRGWSIHRVWSTNWWYFEEQEKQAIIDAINSARGGIQNRVQPRDKTHPYNLVSDEAPATSKEATSSFNVAQHTVPPSNVVKDKQTPIIVTTPNQQEKQVPTNTTQAGKSSSFDLLSFLTERKVVFKDMRSNGGALWLIGDQRLSPVVSELKARGIPFVFLPNGGKASEYKPAWFTKYSNT